MAFDPAKYLNRPDHELYAIYLATIGFLCALGRPRYRQALKAVGAQLRLELHALPRRGSYVRKEKGDRRLEGIPDLPLVGRIGVDFGRAKVRRLAV